MNKMDFVSRLLPGRGLCKQIAENRDRLYGVALAWCGDAMAADDLVQETLMLSLQRVSQLRDKDKLNAWMYSILSNCWKQYLRRVRPTVDIDAVELASDDTAETGGTEQEIVDHVRSAILRLPEAQRQTITLVDLAGFTYAEVADILEVPIGTVMSRMYTARHSLQRVLVNIRPPTSRSRQYIRSVK